MLALAVLEHWLLVLPLPFERLWSWVLTWRRPGICANTASGTDRPLRGATP